MNAHFFLTEKGLKAIATISMLIDHIGAVFLRTVITTWGGVVDTGVYDQMALAYKTMRSAGRIAFPLFCFLLVQGAARTGSRMAYAVRILVFALISEPLFDLALHGSIYDPMHQNVLWTLLAGLLMIYLFEWLDERLEDGSFILAVLVKSLGAALLCLAVHLMHTDYSFKGVLLIGVLYILRYVWYLQATAGFMVFYALTERIWCAPAFIFMAMYTYAALMGGPDTGRPRGMSHRASRLYYLVYPGHLALLYFVTKVLVIDHPAGLVRFLMTK